MAQRYARRNFFVNREMQGKLIFYYFLLAFITVGFFMMVVTFIMSDQFSIAYNNHHIVVEKSTYTMIRNMLQANWIVMVTGGVVLSLIIMLITHRIAGPLYRFSKTLDAMLRKDLSHNICLRARDEAKPIAGQINEFNLMLSRDLARMETLRGLLEKEMAASPPETRDRIKVHLDALRDSISEYKLFSKK